MTGLFACISLDGFVVDLFYYNQAANACADFTLDNVTVYPMLIRLSYLTL